MPTFFKDELNADVIQFTPRIDPVVGRSNSPSNGAMWYDSASSSFHGIVNGSHIENRARQIDIMTRETDQKTEDSGVFGSGISSANIACG